MSPSPAAQIVTGEDLIRIRETEYVLQPFADDVAVRARAEDQVVSVRPLDVVIRARPELEVRPQ